MSDAGVSSQAHRRAPSKKLSANCSIGLCSVRESRFALHEGNIMADFIRDTETDELVSPTRTSGRRMLGPVMLTTGTHYRRAMRVSQSRQPTDAHRCACHAHACTRCTDPDDYDDHSGEAIRSTVASAVAVHSALDRRNRSRARRGCSAGANDNRPDRSRRRTARYGYG